MRRILLLSILFVAATLLACDEDPVGPVLATTGSITLNVTVDDANAVPQQATQVASTEPVGAPGNEPVQQPLPAAGKPTSEPTLPQVGEYRRIGGFSADGFLAGAATPSPAADTTDVPPSAPAAPTAIDAATIRIIGPTPRTLTGQTPGSTVTIDELAPGSYTVVLEGLVGGATGEVDYFGRTTVSVTAGNNSTANISFNSFRPVIQPISSPTTDMAFGFTWTAVPGADEYYVELDSDPAFSSPVSATVSEASAFATVPDVGTWYVRASSANEYVVRGRAGDPVSVDIVTDIDPSGDDFGSAYNLGFGASAGVVYSQLNVTPTTDEDWYTFEACLGDSLLAEVFAERLDPPSTLDAYIELFGPTGDPIDYADDTFGTDPRLERVLTSSGQYYLKVSSYDGASLGNYQLVIEVGAGSANNGSSCATLPGATNGWTGQSTSDPTDWSDPDNWITGQAPTSTDTVGIPAGANPVLSEDVTVAGLIVQNGGDVDTDVYNLTVTGSLIAGNSITGSGTVILTGTGVFLSGGLPNLYVAGDVSLNGQAYATGNVQVEGALRLNGQQMAVGGTFSTINGSGLLEMTSDADTLAVAGPLQFSGGSTDGSLTAGAIITTAGVSAQVVSATFAPSGSHRVVLEGAADRTLTDVIGVSYFNHLALQTNGTVTVAGSAGQAQINGLLISDGTKTPTVTGGNLLAYGVAVQNMVMDNAQLIIGNGTITALDGVVFRNFAAGTQQLIVNREGGSHTFNNLQFSQDNGASDVYIEARDSNTGDGDQLTVTLAGASPVDGGDAASTIVYDAVVSWEAVPAGPPAQVSFMVQPSTATAGTPISPTVLVTVQDAQTLTVDTSTASVTIAISDNPSGGTLSGTATVSAVNGVAAFGDLSIDMAGGGYSLVAFSPGLTPEESTPFVVVAGAPTTIALESGNNQTASPGATLPDPIAVRVTDQFGNGVAGLTIDWSVTAGGGSVTSSSTTGTDGVATADWTLGGTVGTNTAEASPNGITLAGAPVVFSASGSNAVTWATASSGNWSDGSNWSSGSPPTASDAAIITADGTYTVTVDADVSVESMTLGGGASGPTVIATGQTISATGTVRIDTNAVLSLASSTLNAANVINNATLIVNGGTVVADIDNRSEIWTDGATTLNGVFTSASGSLLRLDGAGADVTLTQGFTNNGTIYLTSVESGGLPSLYVNSGTLINAVGGKIRFAGLGGGYLEADLDNRDSLVVASSESVEVSGTTVSNSGVFYAAAAPLEVTASLTNSGTINVSDGMHFASYGAGFNNAASGQIVMGSNTTLELSNTATTFATGYTVRDTRNIWIDGSGATTPSVTFAGNLVVEQGGSIDVLSNTVTADSVANSGDITLDVAHLVAPINNGGFLHATVGGNSLTGRVYTRSGGTLQVSEPDAELLITGNFTNDGLMKLYSTSEGTAPRLQVAGGTLTHRQWFDSEGPAGGLLVVDSLDNQQELHAISGGTFTIQGGAIYNQGSFVLSNANMTVTGPGHFLNAGGINLGSQMTFTRDGGTFESSGDINGDGTVDVSTTTLQSPGTINPDRTVNLVGADVNLTNLVYNVDIDGQTAGTDHDVINVSENATLDGLLNVIGSYTPVAGDTFTVMTFGSRSGEFTSYSGLSIDAALALTPVYGANDLKLVVGPATDSVVVTPRGTTLVSAGETVPLTAEAYGGGTLLSGKTFTWTSLDPSIATVDGDGLVTAVSSGQTTVQAMVDGVPGYAVVSVAIPGATPVNMWGNVSNSSTVNQLLGVWGASESNVFIGGDGGTILNFDGTDWTLMTPAASDQIHDFWGTSGTDVFAIGSGIQHYDGTEWTSMTWPGGSHMLAGWGSGPNDVWAVSSIGTAMHYDGTEWTEVATETSEYLFDIWGFASDDIWAVGDNGAIIHYDGISWTSVESNSTVTLVGVWGTAPDNVFFVGGNGTILHYDGSTSIYQMSSPPGPMWIAVWGTSASDVYAVGGSGVVARFDGLTWSLTDIHGVTANLRGVWGTPDGDLHVPVIVTGGGLHVRGVRGGTVAVTQDTTLTAIDATATLTAEAFDTDGLPFPGVSFQWSSDDNGVATVDSDGVVTAVSNGSTIIRATAGGGAEGAATVTVSQAAASVAVSPSGASIAGGTQTFTVTAQDANGYGIPSPSATWTSLNRNVATVSGSGIASAVTDGQSTIRATVDGVSGDALLTVWISGATPVNVWASMDNPSTASQLLGIWGAHPDTVFIGGDGGTIIRYDGSAWNLDREPPGLQIWDFWGSSGTDVFAAGNGGVYRYDGADWTTMSGIGGGIRGIWGSSPDNLITVSTLGGIAYYDGASWTSEASSPTGEDLYQVWGTANDSAWAVGHNGTILNFDGTDWTPVAGVPTTEDLLGVWGTSATDIFAVGGGSTILRYNGASWDSMPGVPGFNLLRAVWGSSANDVYAVGLGGTVLRFNGSSWTEMTTPTGTVLTGVWGTHDGPVFVSGQSNSTVLWGHRGASVTVTPASTGSLFPGDTVQLSAIANESGGAAISGVEFSWTSLDPSVATVDANGAVAAEDAGTAEILVTATGGASDTATVTVTGTLYYDQVHDWSCLVGENCQDVFDIEFTAGTVVTLAATEITGNSVTQVALYGPGVALGGTNLFTGTTNELRCNFVSGCDLNTAGQTVTDFVIPTSGTYRFAITRDWGNSCGSGGTYRMIVSGDQAFEVPTQTVDDVASLAPGWQCP